MDRKSTIRRVLVLIFALALFAVVPIGTAGASDPESPMVEYDLIAGQYEDVGSVFVWNSDSSIFVKYVTDDPWMIEEIHLAVGWTEDDIPQTKKHNPIPGQFPIKEYFDPLVSMAGVYEIPFDEVLGAGYDGDVVVAAHAKVWNTDSEMTETVVSRPGVDVYGPSDIYLPLGDSGWGTPVPAVATWVHPSWPPFPDADAVWISNTELIEGNIAGNTWRWFHDEFEVPGYPVDTVVTANADNAEEVYLNGAFVGSDGNVPGPGVGGYEWQTVNDYPISPMMGTNELDFIVRNYPGSSNAKANPTGLIYSVDVTYYTQEETAWGWDGTCEFDGRNWALCMEYEIQSVLLENILVPSRNLAGTSNEVVTSSTTLEAGTDYLLKASGVIRFASWGENGIADAQCSLRPNGEWQNGDYYMDMGYPPYLEVMVGGDQFNWTPDTCQDSHEYEGVLAGTGNPVSFTILDACSLGSEGCYSDNRGFIPVEIWWLP